ncbi:MAG TPA: hypothetical protein ENI15_14865 [Spirochaetes bacterium]|nr:hypothetical protein [Spirochaetota bacterium]
MKKKIYRPESCDHHIGILIFFVLLLFSCKESPEKVIIQNSTEQKFIDAGLIDITTIDDTIEVDLVNSDKRKNFFRENFYSGLHRAYLQEEVALKLSRAQKILKSKHLDFSLLIMDAARAKYNIIE